MSLMGEWNRYTLLERSPLERGKTHLAKMVAYEASVLGLKDPLSFIRL
jgi:hypothetical protein